MGCSAYFIRTFGCPVHCPWCDSAGTWHKDYVPESIDRIPVSQLTNEAIECNPSFVVLTGGEPTVQPNLPHLARSIAERGKLAVHIETCGGFDFDQTHIDWMTLSPKREKLPLKSNLALASEFKIIVDHPQAVNEWISTLTNIYGSTHWSRGRSIWLHPEWSKREDPDILDAISEAVKSLTEYNVRAGYQLHKLYRVDSLDKRSKPTVPLGGNPELGY